MSFLTDLETFSDKKKYQQYSINIYNSSYSVLIDYSKKDEFFGYINENKPTNADELTLILEKFNGLFE